MDLVRYSIQKLIAASVDSESLFSTGIYDIDYSIMTIGGFPRGRVVEIFGPESGGKTLLALKLVANAQSRGIKCAWFDAEQTMFDPYGMSWAQQQGVKFEDELLLGDDSIVAETVLGGVRDLSSSGEVGIVVVDSIPALIPEATIKTSKDFGHEDRRGLRAALLSVSLPQIVSGCGVRQGNCLVVLINQVRDTMELYGESEDSPGGWALRHHCSVRLRVEKKKDISDDGKVVGNYSRVKLVKSKVSPRGKVTGVDTLGDVMIYYDGREVDQLDSLIGVGLSSGLITKEKNTYTYKNVSGTITPFKERLHELGLVDEICELVKGLSSVTTVMDGLEVEDALESMSGV